MYVEDGKGKGETGTLQTVSGVDGPPAYEMGDRNPGALPKSGRNQRFVRFSCDLRWLCEKWRFRPGLGIVPRFLSPLVRRTRLSNLGIPVLQTVAPSRPGCSGLAGRSSVDGYVGKNIHYFTFTVHCRAARQPHKRYSSKGKPAHFDLTIQDLNPSAL